MPFEKGNQLGAKPRIFDQALRRAITQDDGKKVRECIDKLLELAASGEQWAVLMLAERLDGKAVQQVAGTGENGEHVFELKAPWIEAIAKARGWA